MAAVLTLSGLGAQAQTPGGKNPNWCGTVDEQERYFAAHPGARQAQQAFDLRMAAIAQTQAQQRTNYVTDVTIPVVVHIIHTGGSDNISDRQINSAIDLLNQDYQKLNGDTSQIIPLFQPIAASVGFRFRLAKKDPNGNCTTGITRHYAPSLFNDNQSGAIQAVGVWDQSKYLNIWVVNTIGVSSPGGGFVVGYVSPPNSPTNPRDGYVIRHDYFGNQGTSSARNALLRGATHEIGHYFGLSHPWGQTNNPGTGDCTGSDNVADTPQTDGTFNCNLSYAPCGPIANVQNFMDYAECAVMFTQGQRALMRTVLANNRPNLISQTNLVATGTNDGYVAPPSCAPIAAFGVAPGASPNVCVNTPVQLRDYSANFTAAGGPLAYAWSFPGGSPASATGPNPSVSYPAAGFYAVTLTVTNSVGSSTSTLANLVRVEGPTGGETAPLSQSFEDPAFPALFPAPTLRNYELSGATAAGAASNSFVWRRQTAATAADGLAYLAVTNRTYPAGAVTTLVTPNISLAAAPNATLRLARAYALRAANDNVQLRVAFSADCGTTWSAPAVFAAADLSTRGLTPVDGFAPASAADWQTLNVPIPAQFQGSGLFKVRLQLVNGTSQGNTFFLDQLRIATPLAAKAGALAAAGIALYPNPLTRETAVHLTLPAAATVQVSLSDVLGRPVLALPAKTYGAGPLALPLNPAGRPLPAGVYLVRVALDGQTFAAKLTVD